jgi:hypothetical protein
VACKEGGGICFQSKFGLKRKIVDILALLLLNCAQVFTRGEGGSEALIRCMARWGLHVKIHTTSYIKLLEDPRVYFNDYFSHSFLYGPYVHKHIETGSKNEQFNRKNIDDFTHKSPGISVV